MQSQPFTPRATSISPTRATGILMVMLSVTKSLAFFFDASPTSAGLAGGVMMTSPMKVPPFFLGLSRYGYSVEDPPRHICTGSLVALNVVLTSASCSVMVDLSATNQSLGIVVPVPKLWEYSHRPVAESVPHPDFNPRTLENDIALLLLEADAPEGFSPVAIDWSSPGKPSALESTVVQADSLLATSGICWDSETLEGWAPSMEHQAIPAGFCRKAYKPFGAEVDVLTTVCTREASGAGPCPIDPGAPLFMPPSPGGVGPRYCEDVLIGLATGHSLAHGAPELAGWPLHVSTRVASHTDWIVEQMSAWGTSPALAEPSTKCN